MADDVTTLPDVLESGEAAACVAVLEAAIEELPPHRDPFPEWRTETLNDARDRFAEHAASTESEIEPEYVGTLLEICSTLSPTPHERIAYGSDTHPNHVFGEVGVALRPFYGSEIPEAPDPEE